MKLNTFLEDLESPNMSLLRKTERAEELELWVKRGCSVSIPISYLVGVLASNGKMGVSIHFNRGGKW